jgi:drug/metabolite transporter (DMT)-like permease
MRMLRTLGGVTLASVVAGVAVVVGAAAAETVVDVEVPAGGLLAIGSAVVGGWAAVLFDRAARIERQRHDDD